MLLPWEEAIGAAAWPTRPVTAVVGFSQGGGIDTVSRLICAGIEPILKAAINNVNRPGAAASVATDFVWRRPADGYTWLFTATYNKTHRALGYHKSVPHKDWQFFGIDTSIMSWSVIADSPIKDFADLLERARKAPGTVTVSNAGVGDVWHLGNILLERATKVQFKNVPYKGGAPATLAALQKEVQAVGSGIHEHVENIKAGRMRNLAVFTAEPLTVEGTGTFRPVTDFVPTLRESAPYGGGASMALRRDTDPEILKRIAEALKKASEDKRFEDTMKKKLRFILVVTGAAADKKAAYEEVVAANLLKELGRAKVSPQDLKMPSIEGFEEWWRKNAPKPRV
jgi:tripartite-type tricarboxylate transporter receptor subunit TctC